MEIVYQIFRPGAKPAFFSFLPFRGMLVLMRSCMDQRYLPLLIAVCLRPGEAAADPPTDLQCEWQSGIVVSSDPSPELSWTFVSGDPADVQTAYRIRAATSAELLTQDRADLWDSGKVASALPLAEYRGGAEAPVYWNVETWDAVDAPGGPSSPSSFSIAPVDPPSLRPHIRTFINFGSDLAFIGSTFDLSMRAGAVEFNPDHIALNYVILATMVVPSDKADDLALFCVEQGLTTEGVDETMFLHFHTDTDVTLHVGSERPESPIETRTVPGWDAANDPNGDGVVDDGEFASRPVPGASARRMSEARVPIYYWGPPADDFVMNVGHPDYRRFIVEVYAVRSLEEGFQGLFSDTLSSVPPGPAGLGELLEFPGDEAWGLAVKGLAAEVKRGRPDALLFGNGWDSDPFILDGAERENWINASADLESLGRRIGDVADTDARGKILLLQYNPVFDPELSPFGVDLGIEKERDRLLGLAFYYLAAGRFTYFGFGQHPYDSAESLWFDAVEVDVGAPLGPASLSYESVPSDLGDNLLRNGGFEEDADGDGMPDGWTVTPPLVLDEETVQEGRRSVRIDSDSDEINNICSQAVSLRPDTTYTLGAWMRTSDVSGVGANVYIYDFDGVDWAASSIEENDAPDWRHHAVTFTTAGDGEGRVSFRMRLATGTMWLDHLTLVEGEHPDIVVMTRPYEKALVVARPYDGTIEGPFEMGLPGLFRPIDSQGTVGGEIGSVTLRPAEAAILLRTDASVDAEEGGDADAVEGVDGGGDPDGDDDGEDGEAGTGDGGCGCRIEGQEPLSGASGGPSSALLALLLIIMAALGGGGARWHG
jgi:hypothetical protein